MIAVCPGSFDPVTFGHLDVISRTARLFDEVVVAVGQNSTKSYLFSRAERVELVRRTTADLPGVTVEPLDGLLADFAKSHGADVVVKGMRFASDFDFELQMAHINTVLSSVETLILPASSVWATLSSTMVREVASYGGDIGAFVPEAVLERIREKRMEQGNG